MLCFLVLFLITLTIVHAQSFNLAKMDSLFALIDKNDKGMGSLSLFQDGKEVYQKTIGYSDFENNILSTATTKYRIGSVSKTFTSVIIQQMAEENKITLNTLLSVFFPQIVNSNKITIEHLLRHRSGIHNFTDDPEYTTYMTNPKTKEELLELFTALPSDFNPDEKFSYSNTGYVLLTMIAEKVDKKSFGKILEERIVSPLKLKNTYYGSKINPANKEAFSYNKLEFWEKSPETDLSIPMGAGAIVSTPTDLNIFFNSLFSGKLISSSSLETMTSLKDGFGLGIFSIPFYEKKAFGHTGGIDAFRTTAAFFPDDNFSVAYISNGAVMIPNEILLGVLNIYYGRDYALPDFKTLILSSEDLNKFLGTYGSPTFPLKITISKKENVLIAQATGQPSFPLDAYEENKFKFDGAGIKIEFIPDKQQMILKQSGMTFTLEREK